jgi:putative ABC transport system ATP-binding protein
MIAITGPSGCGKSTLLNMIGLLLQPTSGDIIINGVSTSKMNDRKRALLRNHYFGYIAQDFALIQDHTVYENIEIPLVYSAEKWSRTRRIERIKDVLNQVNLDVNLQQKVKYLSGGQQQRVAIARAIVNQPEIILADEPTGALDSKSGQEILNLLRILVDQGKTLLMITHDEQLAKQCDVRLQMSDGKLLSSYSGLE